MKLEVRAFLEKQRDEIFEKLYDALPEEAFGGALIAAIGQLCVAVIEHAPADKRENAMHFLIKGILERTDLKRPALGSVQQCTEDEVLLEGIIGTTVGEA